MLDKEAGRKYEITARDVRNFTMLVTFALTVAKCSPEELNELVQPETTPGQSGEFVPEPIETEAPPATEISPNPTGEAEEVGAYGIVEESELFSQFESLSVFFDRFQSDMGELEMFENKELSFSAMGIQVL